MEKIRDSFPFLPWGRRACGQFPGSCPMLSFSERVCVQSRDSFHLLSFRERTWEHNRVRLKTCERFPILSQKFSTARRRFLLRFTQVWEVFPFLRRPNKITPLLGGGRRGQAFLQICERFPLLSCPFSKERFRFLCELVPLFRRPSTAIPLLEGGRRGKSNFKICERFPLLPCPFSKKGCRSLLRPASTTNRNRCHPSTSPPHCTPLRFSPHPSSQRIRS